MPDEEVDESGRMRLKAWVKSVEDRVTIKEVLGEGQRGAHHPKII